MLDNRNIFLKICLKSTITENENTYMSQILMNRFPDGTVYSRFILKEAALFLVLLSTKQPWGLLNIFTAFLMTPKSIFSPDLSPDTDTYIQLSTEYIRCSKGISN